MRISRQLILRHQKSRFDEKRKIIFRKWHCWSKSANGSSRDHLKTDVLGCLPRARQELPCSHMESDRLRSYKTFLVPLMSVIYYF